MDKFKMAYHCITWGWDKYRKCMETIALLGFRGFETLAPAADWEKDKRNDLIKALKDNGLVLTCTYGNAGMIEKETHETDFERNVRWAEFAAKNGAKAYIVGGGSRRPNGPTEEDMKNAAEILNRIGKRLSTMGIKACVHPHLNTFCEGPEEVHKIMALTDPLYVWLSPDTAHLYAGGANVPEVFRKHFDRIAYIHAKDTIHIHPKLGKDVGSMSIIEVFTELGNGKVPFKEIFQILREGGYSGWITGELDMTRRTPEESANISRDYLRDQLNVSFIESLLYKEQSDG